MGGEETQPIVHRGSYGVVCVSCVVVVWVGGYVYVGGGGGGCGWGWWVGGGWGVCGWGGGGGVVCGCPEMAPMARRDAGLGLTLHDIRSLQSFLALVNHPFIAASIGIAHTIAMLLHG